MAVMLKVKAADGVKVPLETQPHAYIEQATVEVENTLYYQRRLADGDLISTISRTAYANRACTPNTTTKAR